MGVNFRISVLRRSKWYAMTSNDSVARIDALWKDYFTDPSLWQDDIITKSRSRSPCLRHRITNQPLWIHGRYNPAWVLDELWRRFTAEKFLCLGTGKEEDDEHVSSDKLKRDFVFVELLKDCATTKDLRRGASIHADVLQCGQIGSNAYIASNLINMYARCGELTKAQQVLDELPVRSTVAWNALITGYVQLGQGHKALDSFDQMRREGITPNDVTFICILKACGSTRAIDKGKQIHDEIVKTDLLRKCATVGTALVGMYTKCGMLVRAQQVLEHLPIRDAISWSALIAGYTQAGKGRDALNCFMQMRMEGFLPDEITFISVLRACGSIHAINEGERVHDEITHMGLLRRSAPLGNALMDMYVKCGMIAKAQQLLEEVPVRNIVSWNTLITGYVQYGQSRNALDCFGQMQQEGLMPDVITLVCILRACGSNGDINMGKQIHNEIVTNGWLSNNIVLGTSLMDMYCKCGVLSKAQQVLDDLPHRDVVCWSSLISGYVQQGKCVEAFNCFEQMQKEGLHPNDVTFISILKACSNIGTVEIGREVHYEVMKQGFLEHNTMLGHALVGMYAKCGEFTKAQNILKCCPTRNVIVWNKLILGYVEFELEHEALNCYTWMLKDGISPDEVTFSCILKACAIIGAIDKGKLIHHEIVNRGMLEKNIVVGTALVDLYAKCGILEKAEEVLEQLPVRDIISWSALISGYAQNGQSNKVLNSLSQMQNEGLFPDEITFICALNACSHAGKSESAQTFYENMTTKFGIAPMIEHQTCMIAVFGNVGSFDKVISVLKTISSFHDASFWLALLYACRKWGNLELGRFAFDWAVKLDMNLAAAYVHMVDIYATAGMQDDVTKVKAMRNSFQQVQDVKMKEIKDTQPLLYQRLPYVQAVQNV